MLEEVLGLAIIKVSDLNSLKSKIEKLEKDNERLMMTHYSAEAARTIHDEIRKIINCPSGNNIIEAIKKLKGEK